MTKVLVVNDEAALRLLCRVNLEHEGGWEVTESEDGPSGLAKAREERPDVILLDIMMPGADGLSVARELREDEHRRRIPIVFFTPIGEFCECLRLLDFGDVDCVQLPFNPMGLGSFLRDFLQAAASADPVPRDRLEALWALRSVAFSRSGRGARSAAASWRKRYGR
jgi:CheY-like chemotaxis protein